MPTDRPITQDDLNAAARGLRMVGMSIAELRELAAAQGELFAGRVVRAAAEQMIAAKARVGAREE